MIIDVTASLIAPMASSLMQLAASSIINNITGRGAMGVGKGQEFGILPLLALLFMIKVLEKYDLSSNSNSSFHVEAGILNLLFL